MLYYLLCHMLYIYIISHTSVVFHVLENVTHIDIDCRTVAQVLVAKY